MKQDDKIIAGLQILYENVTALINNSKSNIVVSVNKELVLLYWNVGNTIHQFILEGTRAAYGKKIIVKLSELLNREYGKGWSKQQLNHCVRCAEVFDEEQILYAVSRGLSWTHIRTLTFEKDELKRKFYLEMSIAQKWSTRTLNGQIDKMLFERTAIAQEPEKQIEQALEELRNNEQPLNPDLFFKNTYVLDFLGLKSTYSEKELEDALIAHIEQFILELGDGFAFIERQKRIPIDSTDYHLDLLFFHRKLRRLVAIDLKLRKFLPEDKAQMELYLKWLKLHEMQSGEDTPVGLVLCSEGNTEHIELLMLDEKDIRVAQYLTELPSKAWFADKLKRALAIAKMNQRKP